MNTAQIYIDTLLNGNTLLDIVLIAGGLFFLCHTFLRLGTWKILIGILAAFLLFMFASILNLEGIEWIFKNVSHVALLALIVIFQPELRKIFEKVVSLTVAPKRKPANETTAIVAESLWSLAGQKRGAIIVFPGKEQIKDKVSGGYKLNAYPSKPLIMSIFDPNSPGHDGAVIIDDNLLTYLGVRLPMSESSRLSEEYGTRHHAAMGMAEETDSLIFLVSEERGRVSCFFDGNMTPMNSEKEITPTIENHFSRLGKRRFVQKVSLNRSTLLQMGSCLLIAGVFWLTLILGQRQVVERTLNIPLEYTSPAEGLVLMGNRANEIVIHAAGPSSAMNDFVLSEPKALLDLSMMMEGRQTVLITNDNIKRPKDVTLLDIAPSEVELTLANIEQKTLPVVPQLIGQLPNGLKINKITVSPETVQVLGPPNDQENKSQTVFTTPIYLNSIYRDSEILCKIVAPPSFQSVDKRWPDVEVHILLE